jgi:hypothetical protein
VQIPKYDADNAVKLLYFHDQEFKLDHIVEIRKGSALENDKEPETELKDHVGFKGD